MRSIRTASAFGYAACCFNSESIPIRKRNIACAQKLHDTLLTAIRRSSPAFTTGELNEDFKDENSLSQREDR
jgi:hypothetical protein